MFSLSTGVSLYLLGINMRQIFRYKKITALQNRLIPSFDKAAFVLFVSIVLGVAFLTPLFINYLKAGLSLADISFQVRALSIVGLCTLTIGFNIFINSLIRIALIQAFGRRVEP